MKKKVLIEGMSCGHCVMHVIEALSEIKGIENVEVKLKEKIAEFDANEEVTNEQIKVSIENAGYEVKSIL